MNAAVYAVIILVAASCAWLLWKGYRRSGLRLLFWSAICFFGLTASNLMLFVDLVLLPAQDLYPLRQATTLGSLALLIYGFIWEADQQC